MSNYPELKILKNDFSADIDHRDMTGGTFDIRKVVEVMNTEKEPIMHPQLVLFPVEMGTNAVHEGMHTLEHFLAYMGGLRDQLVSLSDGEIDRNTLIDISPYAFPDGRLGFRIMSLAELDPQLFQTAMLQALESTANHLQNGEDIPFANPQQCGQYRFHSREAALAIIEASKDNLMFFTPQPKEFSSKIVVADFRLLKPQLEDDSVDQTYLTPETSYALSQDLEANFVESWQSLGYGSVPQILIGTYGCMTGMYVVADSPNPQLEESVLEQQIHAALTKSLIEISEHTSDPDLSRESHQALNLIEIYSPEAFKLASRGRRIQ